MKRKSRQHGVSAIWTVVTLGALMAFLGIAIDAGNMVWAGQQLQVAADAAALAGANWVEESDTYARDRAVTVAGANTVVGTNLELDGNWENNAGGDVVIGIFDRETGTFTADNVSPNAVQVTARRTSTSGSGQLPLFFGPFLGIEAVDIEREAIAIIETTVGSDSVIDYDGRFDPDEGYTHFAVLEPSDGSGPEGQIWIAQDPETFDVSVTVILPPTYNDNTYGENAVGWGEGYWDYHIDKKTGLPKIDKKTGLPKEPTWKGSHSFRDLIHSDHGDFSFYMDESTVLSYRLDYLHEVGEIGSGVYDSGIATFDAEKDNMYDGEIYSGDPDLLLDASSSFDWNVNQRVADGGSFDGTDYLVDSPACDDDWTNSVEPDWIYETIYEMRIDGDAFGDQSVLGPDGFANGFNMSFDSLHASPSKEGEFVDIEFTPVVVPGLASRDLFLVR